MAAAAWCMPAAADERESAVAEVAQVYERIKIQQPLLQVHHQIQYSSSHQQLAQSLLSDALRALNVALSVMKQQQPSPAPATPPPITSSVVVKAEPRGLSPRSPASADSEAIATPTERRAKKRSRSSAMEGNKTSSSWVDFTIVPYEDGYEWRKYGEKKINGTSYTRSYFRCTYKDDTGCLATKHVQQKDSSSDPPLFQVTYNNKHTCNNNAGCTATTNSSKRVMTNNPLNASMNIKLEPPVLPPTLVVQAYSALCPLDQTMTPCQQEQISIPVSMQQQPCGTATSSTTSSSISGESSCDKYPVLNMAQMAAAAEASLRYDLLYEELSILCDSFKCY
ncbi:unnamed protein product [Urochloa decumbens]|uniref:WRKY domain-containing protein n=1 Tax=Urochloa decumbens TaxID=240449 RepID=A0ABC8WC02_9POAL